MKDNDLLVTELYKDPAEDRITALSVYLTPKTSKWYCDVGNDNRVLSKDIVFIYDIFIYFITVILISYSTKNV